MKHDLILSNSIACRVQTTRCTMMRFSLIDSAVNWLFGIRELIGLSRLIHAHIAYKIDICQNHSSILPNFLLFAWFDTVEFNRLSCSNKKMYDEAVFADRFRYQFKCLKLGYWYPFLDCIMLILHTKQLVAKSSQHSAEFPIVCMIWYGWIQSSAMFKQHDVRWCGYDDRFQY